MKKIKEIMMRCDSVEKFCFLKMMRKDVSGGQRSKFKKLKKNDEKRRFRRSKVKVQKIRKNDEKRLFRRWRGLNSKNP